MLLILKRDIWGIWGQRAHTAVFKMDNQQGPTVQHGELCSVMRQPGWEGSLGENRPMDMYG